MMPVTWNCRGIHAAGRVDFYAGFLQSSHSVSSSFEQSQSEHHLRIFIYPQPNTFHAHILDNKKAISPHLFALSFSSDDEFGIDCGRGGIGTIEANF